MNPDPSSLDNLHDIVAAPHTPLWPPAPAWYWVLGAVAFALMVLLVRCLVHWLHNRYRREALAEIASHEAALADATLRAAAIASIAELLKRVALSAFPRGTVASLHGPEWLSFLDRTARSTAFASGDGAWFERVAYHPPEAAALDEKKSRELAQLARHWILHHRVEKEGESPC